ncbi:MAG TPA: type II CAAX endopeptidase family protein [Candidatus Limnocylindrales bacterium]|nr:type II CAAX endopeptidase family protein [Candidatus Limnocylindrales bacterium]
MTGSEPASDPSEDDRPQPAGPPPDRPGARIFTIEGRSAPGLFVFGWLATLVGFGIFVVGVTSGGRVPAPIFFVGLVLLSLGLIAAAGAQAIERRARGAPFAGPSPFLLFCAVIPTVLVLAVPVLFVLARLGFSPGDSPAGAVVSQLLLLVTYAGLVRLTVVGPGAASWRDLGFRRPEPPSSAIAFGVILAVPLVFISGLLAALLLRALPAPPSPLPEATDTTGVLLNLLAASVIAPLGEELFFRGYATTAWLRAIGPTAAILRGGLFFAFAHVLTLSGTSFGEAAGQAVVAFVVRIPVALALGWLFVRTRSIYPTIALHATFNGLPLLLTLVGR